MYVQHQLSKSAIVALSMVASYSSPSWAVISGDLANPSDWPATLLVTNLSNTLCTGTVVGLRVVMTAAQCITRVPNDKKKQAYVRIGTVTHELTCEVRSAASNSIEDSADGLALCASSEALLIPPERVDTRSAVKNPGTKVLVVGFGCRLPNAVDRQVGLLTAGSATIEDQRSARPLLTGSNEAKKALIPISGAALCPGDAGGGTYLVNPDGTRSLIGVNLLTDFRTKSWVSPVDGRDFLSWATTWSAANSAPICGISSREDCSSATPVAWSLSPNENRIVAPDPDAQAVQRAASRLAEVTMRSVVSMAATGNTSPDEVAARTLRVYAIKNESVGSVVRRVCGAVDDQYLSQLQAYFILKGSSLNGSSIFADDQEIEVLPCPLKLLSVGSGQRYREFEVKARDTAYSYFRATLAGTGAQVIWRAFEAPANVSGNAKKEYFVEAFRDLNPGVDVTSLVIGSKVRVPLGPLNLEPEPAVALAPGEIKPVFALQSSETNCKPPAAEKPYPFDLGLLLDILAANRAVESRPRASVPIVIADSGLFGARFGVFRDIVLANTGDWNEFVRNTTPLNRGPEPQHGTAVATLALGGPIFSRLQAVAEPRIQLVIKRIYKKYSGGGQSWYDTETGYVDTIQNTSRQYPGVVNLSLKSYTPADWMRSLVASDASSLFVVAAGNRDGPLGPTTNKFVYPAIYGGVGSPSLLVVAALDGSGNLADFSNSGRDFVEIAAPGCSVPVFSFNPETRRWAETRLSGTSMAAPIVSFAAALTKSERVAGGWLPSDLKRRLLISADLHNGELSKSVADGRVLNILKSVAIYQDVIELYETKELLFGNLTFVQKGQPLAEQHTIDLKCEGQVMSIQVKDVYKIMPHWDRITASGGEKVDIMKVYYRSPSNSLFLSANCDSSRDLEVTFQDQLSDATRSYTLDQIADVVRRAN